ncbi:MAG: asparagine synthase (glutamine-hydrolyzing) [Clostridia bacterium]|jgi:asparagine synthase (glutamine-hydrolysing)|nr:asparagine synthase (glutamine-hydrolyzing) [Clostridia bacterium]
MCGITGFVNLKKNTTCDKNIIVDMTKELKKRGPDEENFYISEHINLGHRRLVIIDEKNGKQPMFIKHKDESYVIVYNGQLYNAKDLQEELLNLGYSFKGYSDTEVILKAFIHYGPDIVKRFNGIFSIAIWKEKAQELFLARDHFGIKPLFYCFVNETLIFASEIKSLLKHPYISLEIDQTGISELFGLGPAHTPGYTIFKNILEVKPAHFGIFNKDGLHLEEYWRLESKTYTDSFEDTCDKVKFLLEDSINRQLISDVPLCTMLSGGLDSSIITAYASNYNKKHSLPNISTYSVDYVDNDKNFVKSDFQPNSDNYYIDIMKKSFNTNHHQIVIDTPELVEALKDAMIARDFPGMADVDSSLLLFCKHIKHGETVAISGECSDEIFGGYPWFFREDALNSNTFPWSIALNERQELLNPNISNKVNLKDYIDFRYTDCLKNVKILDSDSLQTAQKRKISYLTINWFMQTLLDRADRMSMYNGLELRVPFCDYRLVEYLWNVPWEVKALDGREKGLLRYIVKDLLPEEIVERKKSPYPKTHNPTYLNAVKSMLTKIMANPEAPINHLLNKDYILEILQTNGNAFSRPWFGQLMTGPQLMAYLCQVNMWLERYQPKIEL